MKDTLTLFNRDDFRQRYKHNYGFLTTENGRRLVYIREVSADRVSFVTQDNGDVYYAHAGAGIEFDFIPIVRGWYHTLEQAIFLTRVPARQYHRGISQNNTVVQAGGYGMLFPSELSLALLKELFEEPITYTLQNFLDQTVFYFILSKAFCICYNDVYFFNQRVGTYQNRTITLSSPLVQQEINDVIQRRNLALTVKVEDAST